MQTFEPWKNYLESGITLPVQLLRLPAAWMSLSWMAMWPGFTPAFLI